MKQRKACFARHPPMPACRTSAGPGQLLRPNRVIAANSCRPDGYKMKSMDLSAWQGACRTDGSNSENRPQRAVPDLAAHSPVMGQKAGAKWAASVDWPPMFHEFHRLLGKRRRHSRNVGHDEQQGRAGKDAISCKRLGESDDQEPVGLMASIAKIDPSEHSLRRICRPIAPLWVKKPVQNGPLRSICSRCSISPTGSQST